MKEKFQTPDSRLDGAVSQFYIVRGTLKDRVSLNRLAPNYELLLLLNFGPEIRVSFGQQELKDLTIREMAIIGPLKKTLNYELLPGADFIVVNFSMNGFYRLFKADVNQFCGEHLLDPDTLLSEPIFGKLRQQMSGTRQTKMRMSLLKRALRTLLKDRSPAITELFASKETSDFIHPVKALAELLGKSERTIQLHLKKRFGYSAKEQMRFKRFRSLLIHLIDQQDSDFNWVQTAARFGYYDQSHMSKDFTHYLGISPQSFIKDRGSFCIANT